MTTNFEMALNQHEIPEFFKGEGGYFARGSDWGDHLYIRNWQEMCRVLEKQKAAASLLTHVFEEYVKSLDENYEDAASLLHNVRASDIVRKSDFSLAIDNYDLIDSLDERSKGIIGRMFRFLRLEYDKSRESPLMYTFEEELNHIKKSGCLHDFERF